MFCARQHDAGVASGNACYISFFSLWGRAMLVWMAGSGPVLAAAPHAARVDEHRAHHNQQYPTRRMSTEDVK
jgi:hypothetical protein